MHRKLRRTFLATTSGLALATAVGMLVPSPARALPPECPQVGLSVTCTGLVSGTVNLDSHLNLVNNGTAPFGVYTEAFTTTTNNNSISIASTSEAQSYTEDSTFYAEIHESNTAFGLGYKSTLNNLGSITANASVSATASNNESSNNAFDMTAKSIGVYSEYQSFLNNSGPITATATNSLTLNNFYFAEATNIIGYSAAYGVYGDEGHATVTNNATGVITANSTYTINFTDVQDTKLMGVSSFAVGIALTDSYTNESNFVGSVITNKGAVNATAIMNFTVGGAEGNSFAFYGSTGWFNAPTVAAFGIMADFGSTIINSGPVNATATANFSIANTHDTYIGYYDVCCSYNQDPAATAVGLYIGPEIKPAPWYTVNHEYSEPSTSTDTIFNTGPVNATATFGLTVTNSYNTQAYFGSEATGIMIAYPGYYCCGDIDWSGAVFGNAMITNSGPIKAIATTNLTINATGSESFDDVGSNNYYIYSHAVGIDVLNIGGSEGGPRTTINNSGPITATATSTYLFTGVDVYGNNNIQVSAYATGIHADGFSYCDYVCINFGPSVTNSGILNVLATAQATINYSTTLVFGGGEIDNNVNLYSEAIGIDAHWKGSQIINSGPINATAQSLLTINVTGAGNSQVNFNVGCCSMDAYAIGIKPGYTGTVINSAAINVTALSQLTVTANAPNVDAYSNNVDMHTEATGIGDGEEQLTINNSGNIKVIAKTAANILGNYYANSVYMYAESYGIYAEYNGHVTNSADIQASSIASFTLDVGLGTGSMFAANSNDFYMDADARGIVVSNNSFVQNIGTILVTAATDFTGLGLQGMEGGINMSLKAYARGIGGAEGNTVINDGTINVIASVTVNTPGYYFYGYTSAKAYGIDVSYNNVVTNNGTLNVIASVNFTGDELEGYSKVRAYGIKVLDSNTVLNTGTINVLAGLTINGVTQDQFATGWDPTKSYGIYAKYDNYITNAGTIQNQRIGPNHWAVYLKNDWGDNYSDSYFTNTGTTIGSIHLGANNGIAYNTGYMVFRVQPPSDLSGIAAYGTYDRIVMNSNTYLDTTDGKIVIKPLGNPTAYSNTTIYPYFVRGNNGDTVACDICNGSTLVGLAPGTPPQLTTTSAFFIPSLQTTPTDATWYDSRDGMDLIMTRVAFNAPLGNPDLPGNQGTSGDGLEKAFQELINNNSDPNSAFGAFLGAIQQLGPGQVPGAYQQLAGEITSNMATVGQNTASQLFGALFGSIGQFASSQGAEKQDQKYAANNRGIQYASLDVAATPGQPSSAVTASTPGVGHWMAWLGGYGQTGKVDSQPGISGVTYNTAGAMTGLEYALSNSFRIGFALGGGASWAKLDNVDGHGKSKFFQAAVYGSYTMGSWYVDGAVGYGRHWIDTDRTVGFPGFYDKLKGNFDANQFIAGFETGYRFQFQQFQLIPFAGMQLSVFSQDAYTETGGPAALHFNSDTTTSARGILGAYVRASFRLSETVTINPFGKLAWAHEFGDQAATVSANFAAAPTSSFNVYGAERSRDALIVGAGFELNIGTMYNIYASYTGDLTSRGSAHAGTGGIKIRW